jgi:hypothetical protein
LGHLSRLQQELEVIDLLLILFEVLLSLPLELSFLLKIVEVIFKLGLLLVELLSEVIVFGVSIQKLFA